jgi:hypothetical protein
MFSSYPGPFIPAERDSGSKCIGGWVGPRLILNALGYRQESLTSTENRVTDTLVSYSQPDHHIDLFIFNIYSVTWYDYNILKSWVFRRKLLPSGVYASIFSSVLLPLSYLYVLWSFSHISFPSFHFSTFCSFALSLSYNSLLQYLYNVQFHLSVPSLQLPLTKLYTHKFKTLLGLHHTASNMLKCNWVIKSKLSPNVQDCRRKFFACWLLTKCRLRRSCNPQTVYVIC